MTRSDFQQTLKNKPTSTLKDKINQSNHKQKTEKRQYQQQRNKPFQAKMFLSILQVGNPRIIQKLCLGAHQMQK